LNTADVILLLISTDFINSPYGYSVEMMQAIERHQRGEALAIPIILRPTRWKQTPFGMLQPLPRNGQPTTLWPNQDEALLEVTEGIQQSIEKVASRTSKTSLTSIEFSIQQGDVTTFNADVLALKYAQEFFGTDQIVAHLLTNAGLTVLESLRPEVGKYCYVDTMKCIQADHALFVGVPDILDINYLDIQKFATNVLSVLTTTAPTTRHLAMTIHGVGFGLDEIEAFLAQITGYLQALQSGQFPASLEKITIIDRDAERVQRLQQAFRENFAGAGFISKTPHIWTYPLKKVVSKDSASFNGRIDAVPTNVGEKAEAKPHVFVAMPFKKDMDDIFYYGISQPVRSVGFICERVDQEAFIGDILEQVKKKIETAAVVIAELSGANPNVYLEVGYAWGKGRPTILLLRDEQELRFDVRGQKCLKYERIRDLEESLKKELTELKSKGFI